MAERGDIPPLLAEAATLIRTFGNAAAHDTASAITGTHTQMIEKFLAVLVEYLYVAPAALREFKFILALETDDPPAA